MSNRPERAGHWPEHLPVGALRVGRASAHYDQAVQFYRDLVGLPVLESFEGSYGEDGTIFGLPDTSVHLEIVRSTEPAIPVDRIDMLVFYLPDSAARERLVARMAAAGMEPASQHPYWQANGGVTLPGSGWAGGRVRVVDLSGGPDLTPRRARRGLRSLSGASSGPFDYRRPSGGDVGDLALAPWSNSERVPAHSHSCERDRVASKS